MLDPLCDLDFGFSGSNFEKAVMTNDKGYSGSGMLEVVPCFCHLGDCLSSGARPTNNISIEFEIRSKLGTL